MKLANDPAILGTHIRAKAMINRSEGIGASEVPRGTLFHHYWVNDDGVLQKVNLVIATAQNNLAMNRTVRQLATRYIDGNKLTEGILNRIEAGIRCFDPCISCSTHAIGQMPLHVQLVNTQNEVIDEVGRLARPSSSVMETPSDQTTASVSGSPTASIRSTRKMLMCEHVTSFISSLFRT
jgi:NAD-reducing hydrogenase large subunit